MTDSPPPPAGSAPPDPPTAPDAGPAVDPLDRAAIERLWRDNRRWIASVLIAHKPAAADLEDLLQDVAMTLVAKGHMIRDEAAARGWLRTVAVNAARHAGRRRTRRGEDRMVALHANGTEFAANGTPDPAESAMERELHQRLAALPEPYREPLMLRAVRGLPAAVIGEVLGLGEAAVNTRLARARRMLRGTLPARAVAAAPPPAEPPPPAPTTTTTTSLASIASRRESSR